MITRRQLVVALLVPVLVLLSLAGGSRQVSATHESAPTIRTHVCGPVAPVTTWTAANSPYEMDCSVTVPSGASLTVQAGVQVYAAQSTLLQVSGSFRALGISSSPIAFSCIAAPCGASSWYGIQFTAGASTSSAIAWTNITGANSAVFDYSGSTISNSTFSGDALDVTYDFGHSVSLRNDAFQAFTRGFVGAGGSVSLTADSFQTGTSGTIAVSQSNGSLTFSNVTVTGAQTQVSVSNGSLTVGSSTFLGDPTQTTGLFLGSNATLSLQHVTLQNDALAVNASQNPLSLSATFSSFIANGTAFQLTPVNNSIQINENNIYNNGTNIYIAGGTQGTTVDATNNWWNTSSAAAIGASIYDCRANAVLPCVVYQPFLNGPPLPPPGATPTPTPTRTPTATPTNTPTQTPNPNVQLHLNPTGQLAGATTGIIADGTGFLGGESITVSYTVKLTGGGLATQQVTASASTTGTFSVQLPAVPGNAVPGAYQVTAIGSASHRAASATLTVLAPPTSTPTSTPTNTPTPTPTATATPTPFVKPYVLAFKSVSLWYHTVRVGTWDRIVIQANHHQQLDVSLHVIFPAGKDEHYATRTNKKGRWSKRFPIPRGSISRFSTQAVVIVQLRHITSTKQVSLTFTLVK